MVQRLSYRRSPASVHARAGPAWTVFACLTLLWSAGQAADEVAPPAAREQAVAAARAGRLEEALAQLAELRAQHPQDAEVLWDYAVVLAWSGRDSEVLALAATLDAEAAPAYASGAVARAARNRGELAMAIHWYTAAVAREPDDLDAHLGLAMTHAEMGAYEDALAELARVPARQREHLRMRLAEGYVHTLRGATPEALLAYERALSIEPDNREALRGKALALKALFIPDAALALAREHPGLLTAGEEAELRADDLTVRLRNVLQTPRAHAERVAALESIIADYDRELAGSSGSPKLDRRLAADRLAALTEVRRAPEAIAAYEGLLATGEPLPAYAHLAGASAYLQNRQPEPALRALDLAGREPPSRLAADVERFYALSDLDRFGEARELAAAITEGAPGPQDPQAFQGQFLSAMALAYADQLARAQAELEVLLSRAPGNADARQGLAAVYRWRGWSDRALGTYEQLLAANPATAEARAGRAHSRLDRQDFRAAEDDLLTLRQTAAGTFALGDLERRWALHDSSEVLIETRWGESSGETFGSDQYEIDSYWFSPPIAYDYRFYARTFDSYADFEEGDWDRRRAALGAELRRGPWTARTELSADRSGLDDPGLAGTLDYRIDDRWTLGGLIELNSYDTPLRADRAEVDSDLAGLNLGYQAHESFGVFSGLRYQDFSDGNRRTALFADARYRALTTSRYKLDLTAGAATSQNSLDDAAYFNPDRDFTAVAGLDNWLRTFRHYERWLQHRLHLWAGTYDQKSYGSDLIWGIDYELTWALSDALQLRGGWQRARRVYDGAPEYQTFFTAGLYGWF